MVSEINEDFVGIHSDSGGNWSFTIPGKIEYISESIDRLEVIVHGLFNACEGFIRPTEIEYSVRTYSADGPIKTIDPTVETTDVNFLSSDRKTITNDGGLVANDMLFKSYTNRDEGACFVSEIISTKLQAYLTLSGYDGWLDRTTHQYVKPARFDEVYEGQANHDPIGIRLYHIPASHTTDGDIEFVMSVNSSSDIWFKETPIGRANRRRLEAFFERITERFDVVDTRVTSRKPNRILREFFPD